MRPVEEQPYSQRDSLRPCCIEGWRYSHCTPSQVYLRYLRAPYLYTRYLVMRRMYKSPSCTRTPSLHRHPAGRIMLGGFEAGSLLPDGRRPHWLWLAGPGAIPGPFLSPGHASWHRFVLGTRSRSPSFALPLAAVCLSLYVGDQADIPAGASASPPREPIRPSVLLSR